MDILIKHCFDTRHWCADIALSVRMKSSALCKCLFLARPFQIVVCQTKSVFLTLVKLSVSLI